jgi:hypothetical protein
MCRSRRFPANLAERGESAAETGSARTAPGTIKKARKSAAFSTDYDARRAYVDDFGATVATQMHDRQHQSPSSCSSGSNSVSICACIGAE